jgi:malate/lactate dehydrogenase
VVIGGNGIEKIVEITLTSDEAAAFKRSADAVKELVDLL